MKVDCICSSKAVDYRQDLNKTLSVCVCVSGLENKHIYRSVTLSALQSFSLKLCHTCCLLRENGQVCSFTYTTLTAFCLFCQSWLIGCSSLFTHIRH